MAARGPARTGRRNPALLAAPAPAEPEVAGARTLYVCTARPLKLGEHELSEGVEVPGAETWPRIDAWVSARRVRKIVDTDPHVPFSVFEAWVNDSEGLSLEEFHAASEVASIEGEAEESETTEE